MPRGTHHDVIGMLLWDRESLVLDVSGGGTWRLDIGWREMWRVRQLIGLRVKVTGIRDGFDLLAVVTIEKSR